MKIALLACAVLFLSGCALSASQIKTIAGFAEGQADEVRAGKLAAATARREAAKRIYCNTSMADMNAMTPGERVGYGAHCGYEWVLQ